MKRRKGITIGLFGTCDESRWRDRFMAEYKRLKIKYYNPQVAPGTWDPKMADIEARHLAHDQIILFPVTSESYGLGSLAETGYSILSALKLNGQRDVVILIDQTLDQRLVYGPDAKASLRARRLVLAHLKKLRLDRVYVVDTMDELMAVSLKLYHCAVIREEIRQYNPAVKFKKKRE